MLDKIKSTLRLVIPFVKTKHFWKHFGLVILFYLVMVFATILYLDFATNHGEKIAVPNFVGLSGEKAKQRIEDLDLTYQILDSIYDPKLPEGTVLDWKDDSGEYATRIWKWWKGRRDKFKVHGLVLRLIVLTQLSSCNIERVFSQL